MTDCIIVGGGLIGMLSARELKKAGLDVLVLEKGELGRESSWAGGGILSPLHPWRYSDEVNRLASIGHQSYQQVAEELHRESGVDPEFVRCGMMVLKSEEQSEALAWADKWSMNLSLVSSAAAIDEHIPGLANNFEQGIWLPDIAQMRNPRLVRAAKGSLEFLGVSYMENTCVDQLNVQNGQITGVVANGKTYNAKRVLIAGGAWSGEILKNQSAPDINPVKGQMIIFKSEPGMLKGIVLADNRYIIPRKDGRILCGSTIEHTGFEKSIDEKVKCELIKSAVEIFPELGKSEVEYHWAGLRPGCPDGDPFTGVHNNIEGLYINAGHYRNGVILGIGSCRKITQEICDSL
ncbi:MAG: glycine oxidase ThiO [endosymbiont of Galathealinum brachiosum]|uniref:Glycine oxidase ThiO n=1 Tax=endosymbiont of Galathealinum brachiosum TaxID=2200906 RepID=A0A370DCI8_9GAMM|nr:MAG: glycine oxidase ThiO [endosymbiont of Galathealinum brachiosum]